MIPAFRITTDAKDLTEAIRKRFISLRIKDEAGIASDQMTLTLVDEPPLEFPEEGLKLEVFLGYEGALKEAGTYAIRPVSVKGAPAEMTIEGSVIDCFPKLMSQKERSWREKSLYRIADEIARQHGLQPAISTTFQSVTVIHEDQTESDLSFLTRLAVRFHAIFKIQAGRLILVERGTGRTVSGQEPPILRITKPLTYSFKGERDGKYTGVRAYYWNGRQKRRKQVLVGSEGKVHELRFTQRDEATAKAAAGSKLKEIRRASATLSLDLPGDMELFAGRKCEIYGVRPHVDGIWIIKTVEHSLDSSGFISKLTFERYVE